MKKILTGLMALVVMTSASISSAHPYEYERPHYEQREHRSNQTGAIIAGALLGGILGAVLSKGHDRPSGPVSPYYGNDPYRGRYGRDGYYYPRQHDGYRYNPYDKN